MFCNVVLYMLTPLILHNGWSGFNPGHTDTHTDLRIYWKLHCCVPVRSLGQLVVTICDSVSLSNQTHLQLMMTSRSTVAEQPLFVSKPKWKIWCEYLACSDSKKQWRTDWLLQTVCFVLRGWIKGNAGCIMVTNQLKQCECSHLRCEFSNRSHSWLEKRDVSSPLFWNPDDSLQ